MEPSDPLPKRKRYEISIDSSIHIPNTNCTHSNVFLPSSPAEPSMLLPPPYESAISNNNSSYDARCKIYQQQAKKREAVKVKSSQSSHNRNHSLVASKSLSPRHPISAPNAIAATALFNVHSSSGCSSSTECSSFNGCSSSNGCTSSAGISGLKNSTISSFSDGQSTSNLNSKTISNTPSAHNQRSYSATSVDPTDQLSDRY